MQPLASGYIFLAASTAACGDPNLPRSVRLTTSLSQKHPEEWTSWSPFT